MSILKKGCGDSEFKFDFQSRENTEMIDDLAKTVSKLVSRTPGGVLIFFPSYRVMNDTYERWQKKGGLKEILQYKSVYREPQNSNEYQLVIDRFYSDVYETE